VADDHDIDALGAQYRDARDAIATHRRRQARAELALAAARRRHPENSEQVATARAAVERAVADVRWCQAVTIAAGEAYKGQSFEDVLANQTATAAEIRQRALASLDAGVAAETLEGE